MNKRPVSLRTHVILVFFIAIMAVIIVFYLSNQLLFSRYYLTESRKDMQSAYEELKTLVRHGDTEEEDFRSVLLRYRSENGISFALEGENDNQFLYVTEEVMSEYENSFLSERLQADLIRQDQEGVKIIAQGEDYTIQHVELPDGRGRYLECYGYMRDVQNAEKKFILSMPLESVYSILKTSKLFMIYLGVTILVAAYFLIMFLTYRITEPIYQLIDISKRMKNLDFSARYVGNQDDEIGQLGNNMNELSSQMERSILQLNLANEELQKDIQEKEQVDEMRKDFISNVSHELKTPIALIQGYAEGLKDMVEFADKESLVEYCDIIVDESDKMARMVRKLTTLNQIEFGRDEIEFQSFDIMEIIRGLVNGSKKMQEEHHAKVFVEGPKECMVLGDPFKIEEVINNYYSNAYNHLEEPNEIRFLFNDIGDSIRISVRNTGKPIPEDQLQKIWIKFYKVDKARTRAYGGSGIGLSIVKAIMDAHHEECGVYNTSDGVVFWFELKKYGELVPQNE